MRLMEKVRRHGIVGSARKGAYLLLNRTGYTRWRFRNVPVYANPTEAELDAIELDLRDRGIAIEDFTPPASSFAEFKRRGWFPDDYHGGTSNVVWDEKLLEHWIASQLLGLEAYQKGDIYVDVAAGDSPWAKALREQGEMDAYAIDLRIAPIYRSLPYYRAENVTQTSFADSSVAGMSLHCSYEMFQHDDDTLFIKEAARILRPSGKVVILPLYMHTHYCAYATPEYFGKGCSDREAKEYVRLDCLGIPSSRKYDADRLVRRVIEPLIAFGMHYRLLALRNKKDLGKGIYCHFILEFGRQLHPPRDALTARRPPAKGGRLRPKSRPSTPWKTSRRYLRERQARTAAIAPYTDEHASQPRK